MADGGITFIDKCDLKILFFRIYNIILNIFCFERLSWETFSSDTWITNIELYEKTVYIKREAVKTNCTLNPVMTQRWTFFEDVPLYYSNHNNGITFTVILIHIVY